MESAVMDAPTKEATPNGTTAERTEVKPNPILEGVSVLPLDRIRPSPLNPRKKFDENLILHLADDIKRNGLIQPLVVRPAPDGLYELIAGHRRYLACLKAGLTTVSVVIRKEDDKRAFILMFSENCKRQALTPMEEAHAFRQMRDTYRMSLRDIQDLAGGCSHEHVRNRLLLADKLIPPLQTLVDNDGLSLKTAEHIAKDWSGPIQAQFVEQTTTEVKVDLNALAELDAARASVLRKEITGKAKKFEGQPEIFPEEARQEAKEKATKEEAKRLVKLLVLLSVTAKAYGGDATELAGHLKEASKKGGQHPDDLKAKLVSSSEFLSALAKAV